MDHRTEAGLTARDGRRFALTLFAGFAVLGAIAASRHRVLTAEVFGIVAGANAIAALVMPRQMGPIRRAWLALGDAIGTVVRPLVLGALYWLAITPIGMLRRRFSTSPLARDPSAETCWKAIESVAETEARRRMEHMF